MSEGTVVGFIGLGNLGAPIAMRILSAGWPLRVWARRAATVEKFEARGATVSSSPRALGADCDVVGVCVRTDEEVLDVVLRPGDGLLAGMKPGAILMIHATVLPKTVDAIAQEASALSVHVLDAPVSGGPQRAVEGKLTVILGGEASQIARAQPVLQSFAAKIVHVGPVGSAQILKLLNNNLCYANIVMSIAALELAQSLGLDPQIAASVIRHSSGASAGFDVITEGASFRKITGPTSNVRKDAEHFLEFLAERGLLQNELTSISRTAPDRIAAHGAQIASSDGPAGGTASMHQPTRRQ
jgi:3-hydroxyisobutyrate dehydrogenase